MNALGGLHLVLLAGLGFASLGGLAASLVTPATLARAERQCPEARHRALLLLSLSPALLGFAGLLAALSPSVLALLWPAYDHCLVHEGHVHLCLVHPPRHSGNQLSWLVLALAGSWLTVRAASVFAGLRRASRALSRVLDPRYEDATLDARVLPTSAPLCLLVGVLRPAIVVSEGLLAQVTPDELDVMLHHERAHATRRDTPLRLLARTTTTFMWPPTRTRLLRALSLAAEQSCDEVASRAIGDRLLVAEVILRVERLLQAPPAVLLSVAVSFGGDVPARVSSLLEAPRPAGSVVRPIAFVVLAVFGILAAGRPLHHLTESLLGALTH